MWRILLRELNSTIVGGVRIDFGVRVRLERKRIGLTIEDLAKRSGVSTAALSKIERGERNPTLQNALKIAEGFGITLSDLLVNEKIPSVIIIRKDQGQNLMDPESGISRESLFPSFHGNEFVRYKIEPGKETGKFKPHPPGTREVFIVITGSLVIEAGAQHIKLSAGDIANISGDQTHTISNFGDTTCTFVLAILPQ